MIKGRVVGQQARIGVVFLLPGQPNIEIEFVIDTGFEGALTLPLDAVAALGFPFYQEMFANLADDTSMRVDVYRARILWNGKERAVALLATGKRPLLGTTLLSDHELNIPFADGRTVTVASL